WGGLGSHRQCPRCCDTTPSVRVCSRSAGKLPRFMHSLLPIYCNFSRLFAVFVFINDEGKSWITAQRKQTMLTKSRVAMSVALVLATASAAIAAPKPAVRHQTATARHLPAPTGSARSGDSVNTGNPCYFEIQTIADEEGNGERPPS